MLSIMEINPLIPIGTKIKVEKSKIENLLPNKLWDKLPQLINGEIVDYKMTDGKGIGYVLKTEKNIKIWIFNTELNDQTRREYKIESNLESYNQNSNKILLGKYKLTYELNGNRNVKAMANPFNLINWLMFTFKDIF
tara:strand:+ start:254 stop:664 length:411 start_codon:yes stop_codon:yes gene_type:complete